MDNPIPNAPLAKHLTLSKLVYAAGTTDSVTPLATVSNLSQLGEQEVNAGVDHSLPSNEQGSNSENTISSNVI